MDGVEVINAAHSNPKSYGSRNPEYDKKALEYARIHSLPVSGGSDIHSKNLFGGGTAFRRKITSVADYVQAILAGEDYVMTNGMVWYDKEGHILK